MCSQSVSGSSFLSGYNEEDIRERSGRSRREFEEIDAVLYDEDDTKRQAIKKICEEWSSKPHFRVRGRFFHFKQRSNPNLIPSYRSTDILGLESTASSSFDLLTAQTKDLSDLLNENASGRSSIDSIEGSELTNNSDLDDDDDDDDATNTPGATEQFTEPTVDSFDTDEDDDDEEYDAFSLDMPNRDRSKHRHHSKQPQMLIKCMKDSIVNSLASMIFRKFFNEQQPSFQRYSKLICERNAVKLRPKLRPYSLPPRSLSQNRFSLPVNATIAGTGALVQLTPFPFRATPEPDMKLTGLLRVTPIRISNSGAISNLPSSPRKSQVPAPLPPAPTTNERTSTASLVEKRNQQQISLIGTAVSNLPPQLTIVTTQASQNPTRQMSSSWRYRSATTTTNTSIQNAEPNMRLPPINIERITKDEQLTINRSATVAESLPQGTRAVSGTSTGSNLSGTAKIRTLTSLNKVQKPSRPITSSSMNTTKDANHSSSTSPIRSITANNTPSSILRTTPANRIQQQQQQTKRPVLTTKAPPPPPPSTVIKIPAPHIY